MDNIVKQAMAKWPNVPHCYGWLGLDARGSWRMRDEHTQATGGLGERITHPALLEFINRNYTHDALGNWYFQNGPQRVYVNLQATPYIAYLQQTGFLLHTGAALGDIDKVYLTDVGQLIFQSSNIIAMLDDRDLATCMTHLSINGDTPNEENFMALDSSSLLTFQHQDKVFSVTVIEQDSIAKRLGFISTPYHPT